MRHQVDQQGVLCEPFQVEHAKLTIEQHIMNRRAVQPGNPPALDATGLEVDQTDLHLQEGTPQGTIIGSAKVPRFRAARSESSE